MKRLLVALRILNLRIDFDPVIADSRPNTTAANFRNDKVRFLIGHVAAYALICNLTPSLGIKTAGLDFMAHEAAPREGNQIVLRLVNIVAGRARHRR